MPFVWSIGCIIGPSIGGYFATPAENFPSFFSSSGLFAKLPYLLPNVICAVLLVLAIIAGYFLLEETHPDRQPWSTQEDLDTSTAETPLLPAQGAVANAAANLTTESYGTFDAVDVQRDEVWHLKPNGEWVENSPSNEKVLTKPVVMFVAALGIFTYHSVSYICFLFSRTSYYGFCFMNKFLSNVLLTPQMTYDHLLPIFLQDKRVDDISSFATTSPAFAGGLGLSVQSVGIIMSLNGVIQLIIQGVVFPLLASWLGVYKLLIAVTIGHPIAYFIVPYLSLLPLNWLYPAIYSCLAIRNVMSILAYPLLLIMIKEAAPNPSHLGKINGLAASTGAACRTIASPIAGLLYGLSIQIRFTPLAWWASALVAFIGALQIPFLKRATHNSHTTVHTAAHLIKDRPSVDHVTRILVEDSETECDGESALLLSDAETV
jgi:MFS family permease